MIRSLIPSLAFAVTFSSASFPWIALGMLVGMILIVNKATELEIY